MSSAASPESILRLSPLLVFSVLVAISLAIWFAPLGSTFALALRDDAYTHILLILPLSAAMVFLEWTSLAPSSGRKPGIALLLLAVAALVNAVLRWRVPSSDVQLAMSMLALVGWWMAAFAICFGSRAFRRVLFPLCFLLWMVPLPQFALNWIVSLLQQGSAAAAHALFVVAGVPVAQQGLLVHIPGLTLEVAPECSSIRSSLMLLVTTMVLAHLLLRSFWRKALLVAVAIPVSVAKNGLRIFALGMLGSRVDPSFLTGRLHREGGIIYFILALFVMGLLLWVLRLGGADTPGAEVRGALEKVNQAKA
ncbi:MAG: exosortase/archaeosortase family protein [Candidatus Sulfotelmatobacter sp.]